MQEERNPTVLRTGRLSGKVLTFALGAEIDTLRGRAESSRAGRAAKTLVKQDRVTVTLVSLEKGTALQPHQVAGPVSIQIIRGCLRVTTAEGDVDVPASGLVALGAGVAHAARALEDSAILITVAMP